MMNYHRILVFHRNLWVTPLVLLMIILAAFTPASAANAQSRCENDPAQCVPYFMRDYWRANDGLKLFGNPIGSYQVHYLPGQVKYYTQAFERTVIEYFPNHPQNTQYGRVPVGQMWYDTFRDQLYPVSSDRMPGACRVVATQRADVCGAFLDYYKAHGLYLDTVPYATPSEQRGLFGIPITPVMEWRHNGQSQLVQVFTHARIDYHSDTNQTGLGNVVVDLLNANVALPTSPSTPINFLQATDGAILDDDTLDTFRKAMPATGYWQSSSNGVYVATSSFTYLDYFYSVWAGNYKRYVTMTMLFKNQRSATDAPVYVDYSYITLIDTDGVRYTPSTMTKYLTTPLNPTTIAQGDSMVGQLMFVMPYGTAPAQIEVQFANMDNYVSRFVQIIELRVAPHQ